MRFAGERLLALKIEILGKLHRDGARADDVAALFEVANQCVADCPRSEAAVLEEAAVLVADDCRHDEGADVLERDPVLGTRAGAHLKNRLVGLDRAMSEGLLEALDANPLRPFLERAEVSHPNRQIGRLEIARVERDLGERAPSAGPLEARERAKHVGGDRADDVVAIGRRQLRDEVDPVVFCCALDLTFYQHACVVHSDGAEFDFETSLLGKPGPFAAHRGVDVLDRIGCDSLVEESKLLNL